MAKKHSGLSKAAILAAGVGAAALQQKNIQTILQRKVRPYPVRLKKQSQRTAEKTIKMPAPDPSYRNTERGKYEKNSKAFTTPTVTTKHSPVPKNRKALTTKMHIWWAADWLLSQQRASL